MNKYSAFKYSNKDIDALPTVSVETNDIGLLEEFRDVMVKNMITRASFKQYKVVAEIAKAIGELDEIIEELKEAQANG